MIKYRVRWGGMEPVEVERETKAFVVFDSGIKDKKTTAWQNYFDTELEAIEFVIEEAKKAVLSSEAAIRTAYKKKDKAEQDLIDLIEKYADKRGES